LERGNKKNPYPPLRILGKTVECLKKRSKSKKQKAREGKRKKRRQEDIGNHGEILREGDMSLENPRAKRVPQTCREERIEFIEE